jgi:hypothetical protein
MLRFYGHGEEKYHQDGDCPATDDVDEEQRHAMKYQVFIEYVQEWIVHHDDAEDEKYDPRLFQTEATEETVF